MIILFLNSCIQRHYQRNWIFNVFLIILRDCFKIVSLLLWKMFFLSYSCFRQNVMLETIDLLQILYKFRCFVWLVFNPWTILWSKFIDVKKSPRAYLPIDKTLYQCNDFQSKIFELFWTEAWEKYNFWIKSDHLSMDIFKRLRFRFPVIRRQKILRNEKLYCC